LGIGDCLAVDVAVHLCYNAFDCPRYHR
jgi:hypothetical protein